MQPDRFTIKSQEAVAASQRLASEHRNPEVAPAHLLLALLEPGRRAWSCPCCRSWAPTLPRSASGRWRRSTALPAAQRRRRARGPPLQAFVRTLQRAEKEMAGARRRVHLHRALPARPGRQGLGGLPRCCPTASSLAKAIAEVRGPHRVTYAEPRGHDAGAREVRPRPDRRGRAGQARPGDRPRRGDPAGDPGALAADQEQPGADRRSRASARPRSSRDWRSESSPATSPRAFATAA